MIRITFAIVLVIVGCGSPATKPVAPSNRTTATVTTGKEHVCERARALRAEHCSPFDEFPAPTFTNCSITEGLYIAAMQDCMDEPTCKAVQSCFVEVRRTGGPYKGPTAPCADETSASVPAGVGATELEASYGHRDAKFSDSPSTVARPIEVCGMPDQLGYLTRLTCDDGSHPFASRDDADASRVGNVGKGGRCGRIVDHYQVPCPEKTYDVFIDPYRCLAK